MNNLFSREFKKILVLVLLMYFTSLFTATAQTTCQNETGMHDDYFYSFWKDSGYACMTLNPGGTFSCEWSNAPNMIASKGLNFDRTQTHQQIGRIFVNYGCDYQTDDNLYLGVYGWTDDPLIEYYIVDCWGNLRPPPDAESKGTFTVDGGTYDIYETTWIDNFIGGENHQQYWSVRTSKRTSGTISVSQHFDMWESIGMDIGYLYDVMYAVEGFESGYADVYSMSITINDPDPSPDPTTIPTVTPEDPPGDVNADGTIDIIDALLIAQYYVDLNPANFNPDVADTNCDGEIDIVDALLVAQYYVGLINSFC